MATPFPFSSGQILTAAQMNSIGEAAIAYTPTVTAGSGSFTTVSATGNYIRVNKFMLLRFVVTITNNGTANGSVNISVPFTYIGSGGSGCGSGREQSVNGNMFNVILSASNTVALITPTNGYPGGTGFSLAGFALLETA
jgi:hypothetical protein